MRAEEELSPLLLDEGPTRSGKTQAVLASARAMSLGVIEVRLPVCLPDGGDDQLISGGGEKATSGTGSRESVNEDIYFHHNKNLK